MMLTAAEDHKPPAAIELSPDLLELLRAEMREISSGVQTITVSLAMADWDAIERTGSKIRDSYIMKQKLTAGQKHELHHSLPDAFKHLDAQFHARAGKLAAAAVTQDYELVSFHFSRLIESCASCHVKFASNRFPGFAAPAATDHSH